MLELRAEEFALVAPLFKNALHNKPIVFSVIEHNCPGRVFVDRREQPGIALVAFEDYIFLSGDAALLNTLDRSFADFVFNRIISVSAMEYFEFYTYTDVGYSKVAQLFAEKIVAERIRKTFKLDMDSFRSLGNWRDNVPDNFRMEEIDSTFIRKHGLNEKFWEPSTKRFGSCLCREDEIVSQCISVFVGGGMAEIGIDTDESYRRRGFARITASAFIETCFAKGLVPNWTCWEIREASIALAQKLGFRLVVDTPVLILSSAKS